MSYREGSEWSCAAARIPRVALHPSWRLVAFTLYSSSGRTKGNNSASRKCSSLPLLSLKYLRKSRMDRKVLFCPKNHSGGSRDKLDLKDKSIHSGQDTHDSPGKRRWLWQQPVWKHWGWKKGSSKKSIASSSSSLGFLHPSPLSVNPCTTLSFSSGATESGCPAAPGEEEALQKGPVVLLGGCKPSLGQPLPLPTLPAAHRAALPSLPASSAAENELGRWQSVSRTLQS